MNAPELLQLHGQPMAQWAFGSQFVQQLLGSLKGRRLDLGAAKNAAPAAGDLLLS
jgi:hypothetical protein